MMKIGEFAGWTGLSVKALRHYEGAGVLLPADVEPGSGYRRYDVAQVRDGVVVRALRDAGVPLAAVAAVLAETREDDGPLAALDSRRAEVLRRREIEDAAFENTALALRNLRERVEVVERDAVEQPFLARVITVAHEGAQPGAEEAAGEALDAAMAQLYGSIQQAGLGPSGPMWTSMRPHEDDGLELWCCWPVTRGIGSDTAARDHGADVVAGTLPARRELVATWVPHQDDTLAEGYTHPAVVAILEALRDRRVDAATLDLRQGMVGHVEGSYAVEVSLTLP